MGKGSAVIDAATKYATAVREVVVSCGYAAEDVVLITEPAKLQAAYRGQRGLLAAVAVDISSFAFESVALLDWDGSRFELEHYGWKPGMLPRGVLAEAVTESIVGFWKD